MKITQYTLLGLMLAVAPIVAAAAEQFDTDEAVRRAVVDGKATATCHFGYNRSSSQVVLGDYNKADVDNLRDFIASAIADTVVAVRQIVLTGYCSPEGTTLYNDNLARQRATELRRWLDDNYSLSTRYTVVVRSRGADWQGLRAGLRQSTNIYAAADLIQVLDLVPPERGRIQEMKTLHNGVSYEQMEQNLFPQLRRVEIAVEYDLRRTLERKYGHRLSDDEYDALLAKYRCQPAQGQCQAQRSNCNPCGTSQCGTCQCGGNQCGGNPCGAGQMQAACGCRGMMPAYPMYGYPYPYPMAYAPTAAAAATRAPRAQRTPVDHTGQYWRPILAIKTNLVQAAGIMPDMHYYTPTPNLMAEYFIRPWLSVEAKAVFANWDYDKKLNDGSRPDYLGRPNDGWTDVDGRATYDAQHHGVAAYSGEVRYWFLHNGQHQYLYAGLYGQGGDFTNTSDDDSRNELLTAWDGRHYTLKNMTGTYWQAGFSVGCYLPLSRHWGLEAGLRFGYQHSKNYAYMRVPDDLNYCYDDKRFDAFQEHTADAQYTEPKHLHAAPENIDDKFNLQPTYENKFKVTETRLALVYRIGKWYNE